MTSQLDNSSIDERHLNILKSMQIRTIHLTNSSEIVKASQQIFKWKIRHLRIFKSLNKDIGDQDYE